MAASPAVGRDLRGAGGLVRAARGRRSRARARGIEAFRSFVQRSDDRRLERTVGSRAGLRLLFAALRFSLTRGRADGFVGELCCELSAPDGALRVWTVEVGPEHVSARPGRGEDPRLTVKLSVADFVRIAGGDLDAGRALLTGRMDLEGDFAVATQLGELFGRT